MKIKSNLFHVIILFIYFVFPTYIGAQQDNLDSPNKKIQVHINTAHKISYSIFYDGQRILLPSTISLTFNENMRLGTNPTIKTKKEILL